MLLVLLHKKQSSSFGGSSIHSRYIYMFKCCRRRRWSKRCNLSQIEQLVRPK